MMKNLQIDNSQFHIPTAWADLSTDQFLHVAELATTIMSRAEWHVAMLLRVTGLRVLHKCELKLSDETYFYLRHGITKEFLLRDKDMRFVTETFNFMFEKVEPTEPEASTSSASDTDEAYRLNFNCIHNRVGEIPSPYGLLHGPADGLSNILYSEYIHAETAWDKFKRTGKYIFAVRLAAILFRPQDESYNANSVNCSGDPRETFNDFLLDARMNKLITVERRYINAVLMYYEGCRRFVRSKWPEVFNESSSASGSTARVDVFTEFMKQVNSLSENDVTRLDKVRQSYLYEVMFTLQAIIVENNKLKTKT